VPAGRDLYVTAPDGREARVRLRPGETLADASLAWSAPEARARGALASALDRGLFAMAFGPGYYRGFVDAQPDLMAVPLGANEDRPAPAAAPPSMTRGARAAFVGAAVLAAASLSFTAAALVSRHDFEETPWQRPAADALARMHWERDVAIATGVAAAASAGLGVYLGRRAAARVTAGVGPGGGLLGLSWDAW
jgi:hypothetical protein